MVGCTPLEELIISKEKKKGKVDILNEATQKRKVDTLDEMRHKERCIKAVKLVVET